MNKPEVIVLHHTLSDFRGDQIYIVNQYHQQKFEMKSRLGWWVTYHWFVERTGKTTQVRGDDEDGAHAIGWNFKSIGICLAGDFNKELPTKAQIDAVRSLIVRYKLPLKFHREVLPYLTCPGPINKSLFDPPPILPALDVTEVMKVENIKKQISILTELVHRFKLLLALLTKNV